jgi:hypothetical protein
MRESSLLMTSDASIFPKDRFSESVNISLSLKFALAMRDSIGENPITKTTAIIIR